MTRLPAPIAAYVDAANARDAARVAACFLPDGTVHDEGALRRGTAEIAAWAHETAERYGATITPQGIVEADGGCRLKATVSGDFPGSPATLAFAFVLVSDRIRSLEIGA
jgi:ketosteroid isomerase-like protein